MESTAEVVAADLGASSGRVMLGRVGPRVLDVSTVVRFRNGPVTLPDGLHWDVLGLYTDILDGLRQVARAGHDVRSVAVDSWAVDYGLVDAHGALLGNPFHYRDGRTAAAVDAVHARVDPGALYAVNGLQHLPFNTVLQLVADGDQLDRAERMLLIPDLIGYWLCGQQVTEETNASTTGLFDARSGGWATGLAHVLGLPRRLLADIVPAGTPVGALNAAVRRDTGLPSSVGLVAVASHDTASAVAGVPAEDPDFAYISCGTWALVGVELEAPVLTAESRTARFTNERGVDGTVRYLRNVMGLWLLQESLRTWTLQGHDVTLRTLLAQAAQLAPGGPVFDPDSPEFLAPGDLPARIQARCRVDGVRVPSTPAEIVRAILDSLATAFATAVEEAVARTGRVPRVIHLVGGGARNELLCQLTADACGRTVLAGPAEATAIGNVIMQARAAGTLSGDRWRARALIRGTHQSRVFTPRPRPAPGADARG